MSNKFDGLERLLQDTLKLLNSKNRPKTIEEVVGKDEEPINNFGMAVLQNALADVGVREDLGKNDGKRIREYFKNMNSSTGQNWCAAAVSTWMKEAGGGPIPGSLGAKEIARQFSNIGKWVPREKLQKQHLTPGNIAVWQRGDPKSWMGHIGVIKTSDDNGGFTTVEANSGPNSDAVVINNHNTNDSSLLGVGILSDFVPKSNNSQINYASDMSNEYYKIINSIK